MDAGGHGIARLMANGTDAQLIDLIREILHSKFEVSGQQRIRANYLTSHQSELREKKYLWLSAMSRRSAIFLMTRLNRLLMNFSRPSRSDCHERSMAPSLLVEFGFKALSASAVPYHRRERCTLDRAPQHRRNRRHVRLPMVERDGFHKPSRSPRRVSISWRAHRYLRMFFATRSTGDKLSVESLVTACVPFL